MQSIISIVAIVFAIIFLTTSVSAATHGNGLEWRSGGKSSNRPLAAKSNPFSSTGHRAVVTARATEINSLRASRQYVDSSVRQAGFEEESGPQFSEASGSSAPVRSVIVDRSETDDGLRSAQLPSSSGGASNAPGTAPGAPGSSDALPPADLETPAIDTSQLPPLEDPTAPGLDTPPLPDDTQQPPEDTLRQPAQPPARQPSTEFQPRVPTGVSPGVRPGTELPATPQLSEAKIEEERQKSEDACEKGFADLREKTIDKLSLNIAVTGEQGSDYPFECTLGDGEWHGGRCWEQTTYMWKASALCHKPLYFEDEQLERYGHSFSPCLQPFVSGAHFFTRLPVLPYCMGVEPPCECIYALGHYRPGNCAPYMCNPIPISPRGALIQAGAVTGAAAAVP